MITSLSIKYQRAFLIVFLPLAGITSCTPPTTPINIPTPNPTITLVLPDTAFWGDSVLMVAHTSIPLKPTWCYSWTFGDSSTLLTTQDSIIHYYQSTGNFGVKVVLNDTLSKTTLVSRTATIQVIPRHFDLALLQSMPFVTLTWQATWPQKPITCMESRCGSSGTAQPGSLSWKGNDFSDTASFSYNNPYTGRFDSGSSTYSQGGTFDSNFTQLTSYSENSGISTSSGTTNGGSFCYDQHSSIFNISGVRFKRESPMEVVFESRGPLIQHASNHEWFSSRARFVGSCSDGGSPVWTDSSYVTIRFHK